MSPDKSILSYNELIGEILRFCREKKTGTALIATSDNQLARIMIENGDIIFLAYGRKHGQETIPLITAIKSGRLKFSSGKVGAYEEGVMPPSHEVLEMLVGNRTEIVIHSDAVGALVDDQIPEAIKIVENELIEFLGPMAGIVLSDNIEKIGDIMGPEALTDLIDSVAKEIGDSKKTLQFIQQVEEKIGSELGADGQKMPPHKKKKPAKSNKPSGEKSKAVEALSPKQIPVALKIIEMELIEFLGPMAGLVWSDNFGKAGNIMEPQALNDLINTVANEIGDPAKSRQFKQQVEEKIDSI